MRTILNRVSRPGLYLGLLLALCLMPVPTRAQASAPDEEEIRTAVETWVRHVTADARPDAVVERMEAYAVDGEIVAYVAHLKDGGFCIAGADDLVLPVYFYSPQGKYDPQNSNYQYILWEIGTRLKTLRRELAEESPKLRQYQESLSERAMFWQDLIAGRDPRRMEILQVTPTEPISMTLDLTSHWHQGPPYNDECPVLTPTDEHTLVGCVATAMAQIMYYWNWPNAGVGTGNGNYDRRWRTNWDEEPLATDPTIPAGWGGRLEWAWNAVDGGRLRMEGHWDLSLYESAQAISNNLNYQNALAALWDRLPNQDTTHYNADFGTATYNWNILQDNHTLPRDDGDPEAAKLSYHAGVAVGMHYGVAVSSAQTVDIDNALEDHFRYDPDGTWGARNVDAMTEEIQWLRPVVLSGCARPPAGGCHAWIAFGYNRSTDPNRQFLMNLGWGGNSDGWYSVDDVRLFPADQEQVIRIAPQSVVRFVGDDNLGDGSPDDPHRDIEEAVSEAPDGATLIFQAGSVNIFSAGTLIINRPLVLRGQDVTIRK